VQVLSPYRLIRENYSTFGKFLLALIHRRELGLAHSKLFRTNESLHYNYLKLALSFYRVCVYRIRHLYSRKRLGMRHFHEH
jgi:hypothetical protein